MKKPSNVKIKHLINIRSLKMEKILVQIQQDYYYGMERLMATSLDYL